MSRVQSIIFLPGQFRRWKWRHYVTSQGRDFFI